MAKAVFTYRESSRYDDDPALRYQFPKMYLGVAERTVGDWIIYYEPRRTEGERAGGRQAYFAVARVAKIERDPRGEEMFVAQMADYLPFTTPPRYESEGVFLESALRHADGRTNLGAFQRAMRNVPDSEFEAILVAGFSDIRPDLELGDWRGAPPAGFGETLGRTAMLHDPAEPFVRPFVERLTARPFRDAAFARDVKAAYANTCAMTGLRILNGGGRPEVQAAHIRAVEDGGPDSVRNGLALSGTMHWMFDRGLVSIDDDLSILMSESRLPPAAKALIRPNRRLMAPEAPHLRPHPAYLAYHREHRFKG